MERGRSISLSVSYRPNRTEQIESDAGTTQLVSASLTAGTALTLEKAPIYASATATSPAGHKSGIYFLYDGICMRGRYRITNTATRCGKTPMSTYVTGWLPAEYCGASKADETPAGTEDASPCVDVTEYVTGMTYEDNASDNSDSVDVTLNAEAPQWLGEWLPSKGAMLCPKALGHNWENSGDERVLECGSFVLDDISYSDAPSVLKLSGVSKPADSDFSERKREVVWKNTSIKRIGQTIAERYALSFTYDGEDRAIDCAEQDNADSTFFSELCQNYGLVMKVYAGHLWVYDRESFKAKPAVCTFDRADMARGSVSWSTTLYGTYTGGEFSYTDTDTDRDISCSVGGGSKIKKVSRHASSVRDAAVQLCAELNRANHGTTTLKFTVMGQWGIGAGNNISVTGFGGLNGKYFVDKITHKLTRSGGFVSELTCSLVEEGFHPWEICGGTAQKNITTQATTSAATSTAQQEQSKASGLSAGTAVKLDNAVLYGGGKTSYSHGRRTGVYYLYDGVLTNGRYLISNLRSRCGKLPQGENVIGWVAAEDCVRLIGGTLSADRGSGIEKDFMYDRAD